MHTWRIVLPAALLWTVPAAGQEQKLRTYTIHHAIFGDIGTLSDEITHDGASTRVVTRAEIKVYVLGMMLHHVRAEWHETWHADTLRDYRAITTRNGHTTSSSGQHEDGKFAFRTPKGKFTAPADIHPVHPWSLRFVRAATLISPESGRIFAADITDNEQRSIRLGGVSRSAHHYVLRSDTTNHLYFDDEGTLLLAEYRDITGKVSFALQSDGAPRLHLRVMNSRQERIEHVNGRVF